MLKEIQTFSIKEFILIVAVLAVFAVSSYLEHS